ncbi:MAG: hydrogenase small subunit [Anaerosomatales bacterium]|nr:hydrogenase small subunit [Anaerosomatales bacterium]
MQEASGQPAGLQERLESHGVTRRDFLKYCASIAALLGLSESAAPQVAAALEKAGSLKPVVWMEFGSCSGCTESLAQSDYPDVASIVLDILSVNYSETLMAGAGWTALEALESTIEAGGYLLVCEGAVMTGWDSGALMIGGKKATDDLAHAAEKAEAVIAVGACAVDGGFVSQHPNPAGGTGVQAFLDSRGIDKPVINIPCCPMNPEWLVAVVVDYLLLGALPPLVERKHTDGTVLKYPKFIAGQTIHDNCPRRGHFENGEFVTQFGSKEEAMGYCLYKVGCKGPQTFALCPVTRWNRSASWCVESGAPCIGCASMDWVDNNSPFLKRMSDTRIGDTFVQPGTIGAAVGAVAAAGLVVHGIGMKAAGRIGDGPPMEEMKAYDRKRLAKKGGDK